MLHMRVYSERTVDKDGIMTKTGEDAFPYVNEAGMFVADGMGGGAGVAILSFPPECFDEEKLTVKFSGMVDKSKTGADDFFAYVKQNFSSLTDPAMKQLYEEPNKNTLRLKKSGYVGSHALGLTMTAWLIFLAANQDKFADPSGWEEQILKIKDSLFDDYKRAIDLIGCEYAKVTLNKIDYYGTTLTAAFFKESADSVDVIFLNCGDSRSYVWDEKGFRQASDDQGRNGGMSSRFSLGKDITVRISYEHRTYKKPCSIFCMTDGIYGAFGGKNGFQSSPLYMEGFLMNTLSSVNSMEEAQQRLKEAFDLNGQFDDSNSMVMAAFGYESYQEIKEAAAARMEYLNSTYSLRNQPDDFLLEDYQKTIKMLQLETGRQLLPLLQKAYKLTAIKEYCMKQIKTSAFFGKYCAGMGRIQGKKAEISRKRENIKTNLLRIAEENFVDFVDWNETERPFFLFGTPPEKKAMAIGTQYQRDLSIREKTILRLVKSLQAVNDEICGSIAPISIAPSQTWTENWERNSIDWAQKTEMKITDLLSESIRLSRRIAELSRSITRDKRQWQDANIKAEENYAGKDGIVSPERLISEWISASDIEKVLPKTTLVSTRQEIITLVKSDQACLEQIKQLSNDLKSAADEAAQKYWKENASRDIGALLQREIYFAEDPELKKEIINQIGQNEELKHYQVLYDQQKDVFTRYLDVHLSDVSEEKRADVEKCGWI